MTRPEPRRVRITARERRSGVTEDRVAEFELGQIVTIGRSTTATFCVDPDDRTIGRFAATIQGLDGYWYIQNTSTKRDLALIGGTTDRQVLKPSGSRPLGEAIVQLELVGRFTHRVTVEQLGPAPTLVPPPLPPEDPSISMVVRECTPNQLEALVALFGGYLEDFPRHDPNPRTYADAGALSGLPATTVRRRVEQLAEELTERGVPDLHGDGKKRALGAYVLETGMLRRDHLDHFRQAWAEKT